MYNDLKFQVEFQGEGGFIGLCAKTYFCFHKKIEELRENLKEIEKNDELNEEEKLREVKQKMEEYHRTCKSAWKGISKVRNGELRFLPSRT